MRSGRRITTLAATLAVLLTAGGGLLAQPNVGRTILVVDRVLGQIETTVRRLAVNDGVFMDERIATEADSASEIIFLDGTTISLGPNSEVVLDRFVFDPNSTSGAFNLNAAQGVFRFVSGSLGSRAYRINTPTATIGTRGTIFSCLIQIAFTTCSTQQGTIEITDAQTGQLFVLGAGQTQTIPPTADFGGVLAAQMGETLQLLQTARLAQASPAGGAIGALPGSALASAGGPGGAIRSPDLLQQFIAAQNAQPASATLPPQQ